jgi:hypothetical protein
MVVYYPDIYTNPIERERAKAERLAAEIAKAKAAQVKIKPLTMADVAAETLEKMKKEAGKKW